MNNTTCINIYKLEIALFNKKKHRILLVINFQWNSGDRRLFYISIYPIQARILKLFKFSLYKTFKNENSRERFFSITAYFQAQVTLLVVTARIGMSVRKHGKALRAEQISLSVTSS